MLSLCNLFVWYKNRTRSAVESQIAIRKDILLEIVAIKILILDFETPMKESIFSKAETKQLATLLKLNSGLVVFLKFFKYF